MKRIELVQRLVKEGMSEKTLANFSDKQIISLSERMLGEQMSGQSKGSVQMKKTSNPSDIKKVTDSGINVTLNEKLKGDQKKIDKNHNGKIDAQDFKILKGQKKEEVKEGLGVLGGKHKKIKTVKHDGHEIDVFSNGRESLYAHPRKEGSKNQNDKERLVYSDLEGLKKSAESMSKGEKNVNFPKSKKIGNPDYKSTVVDINEVDMGLTIKGSKSSSSSVFGGVPKKSSSPKKKFTSKKKEEGETEEGKDSLHDIIHGAIKDKLKGDLGREPEQHEVEEEHQKYIDGCKTESDEPKKEDDDKKFPFKKKKEEDVEEGDYHNERSEKALEKSKEDFPQLKNIKKCEECGKVESKCKCKKEDVKEVKNWVNSLVENENFHSFTSKNEIMELIQSKINESETMTSSVGPKVNKGHNGIPEFMSYEAIKSGGPAVAPTKPKPGTKPGTNPGTKPKTPYRPGIKPSPKPKASFE